MLKIRLQRIGRRNQPFYRVVVTDSKFGPKSGRFLEVLGSYNPKQGEVEVKKDRVQEWLDKGAQVSGTVHNFLVDQGIIKGKKLNVLPKKSPTKKRKAADEPEEAPAPAAPAAETPVEEKTEETPAKTPAEEPKEEKKATDAESSGEPKEEAPAEPEPEQKEEAPAEEPAQEETKEDTPKEKAE